MTMKLERIDQSRSEAWDAFVQEAPNASILQSYAWGIVKGGAWRPIYFAVTDGEGKFLATALILQRMLPIFKKPLWYCPRGPVFSSHDPELIKFLFDGLKSEASKAGAFTLRCDPEVDEANAAFIQQLSLSGLRRNPENIQPRGTIILDVRPDEESLLKSFHHKTRYNIKLAEKKGVLIEEKNSEEGVDIFYELFRVTADRDKFLILQKPYFYHLRKTLADRGLCTIFVASYEGKPLGAIFQTLYGKRMTYLYGASSNEHRNLMPNHLIHWRAIQWAKARGGASYDFWGIPASPNEDSPLAGVYRFKKGFCDTETRWIGTYELILNSFWYWVFEKGAKAFKTAVRFMKTGKIKASVGE